MGAALRRGPFPFSHGLSQPLSPLRYDSFPNLPAKTGQPTDSDKSHGLLGAQFLSPVWGSRSCFLEWHMVLDLQVKGTFSSTSTYIPCILESVCAIWTFQEWPWQHWLRLFSKAKGQRSFSQLSTWPAAPARQSFLPSLPSLLSPSLLPFPPSFQKYSHPNFRSWSPAWKKSVTLASQ